MASDVLRNDSSESFRKLWSQAYSLATDALGRRDHQEFLKLIDAATINAEEYLHSSGDRSLLLLTIALRGDEQLALENPGEALKYYQAALALCTDDLPECTLWYASLKVRIAKCRNAMQSADDGSAVVLEAITKQRPFV
jgi:hypothetical protein